MEQLATACTTGTLNSRATRIRACATARTYTQRAFTHLFEGEYDRAEIAYRAALCLNPVDGDVTADLESLGRALSRFSGVTAAKAGRSRPALERIELHQGCLGGWGPNCCDGR